MHGEVGTFSGGALHLQSSAGRLDSVFEADESRAALRIGAANAIVADSQPHVSVGHGDGNVHGGSFRMLGRVRQSLGYDVVHGHLDALRKPVVRLKVEHYGDRGTTSDALQGGGKATSGECDRVDA